MPCRAQVALTVSRAFDMAGDLVRPVTLTRRQPGPYDPASGRPAAATPRQSRGRALMDRKPRTNFTDLLIKPGQQAAWLTGLEFAPRDGDQIDIDGESRTVRFAKELPGGLFLVVAE